jgi:uncharacterized protein (TIGR02147 family)
MWLGLECGWDLGCDTLGGEALVSMTTPAKHNRPEPWMYTCHREYLKAMIDYLSATKIHFSFRQFSRKAGYASPNYLRLIADGKRNLSHESIGRFARALELSAKEHESFEALVLLDQAKTDAERNIYYRRLKKRRARSSPLARLENEQFEIYSSWYILPIREMSLLPDFKEDPEWIAQRLHPPIKASQATQALELLFRVGLITRDDNGSLAPSEVKLVTPPTVKSLAFRNYHRALLGHSSKALDGLSPTKRNITSVTVGMSPRQYELVCKKIEEFRHELLDLIEDDPHPEQSREVHVLGFQVVPLTQE